MKYKGTIAFDRELSYSQAQQLSQLLREQQAALEITPDGRGLRWTKVEPHDMCTTLVEAVKTYFKPWRINVHGVINVVGKKDERTYDIVLLKNRVKIYENGEIRTLLD